jgi:hypothetical protein
MMPVPVLCFLVHTHKHKKKVDSKFVNFVKVLKWMFMRFDVLKSVLISTLVFRKVMPCGLTGRKTIFWRNILPPPSGLKMENGPS